MWLRRRRPANDFSEEIRADIAIETDRLIEEGMSPDDALTAARRAFGNVTQVEERFYKSNRTMWLDDLYRDVRHSLRTMAKRPAFAAMAILTLALGIGANTAIFVLLDAVVLKPLAVPAAGELITLYETGPGVADTAGGTGRFLRFSYPRFQRLAAALGSRGTLAAATRSNSFLLRQSDATARTRVSGQLVSGGYFRTLQVLPKQGRLLDEDDVRNASPVAVISDTFWRRALNSSANAVGQTLVLNDLSVTIVGIAERQFFGMWTDSEASLWLPLTLQQAIGYQNNSSTYGPAELQDKPWGNEDRIAWLNVIGRVPRYELGVATAALESANHQGVLDLAATLDPRDSMRTHTLVIEPFARGFSGLRARYSEALTILSVLVAIVLLATCSSVANLLLARAASRARESGVRIALGASAGRLLRQGLTESLILAFAGGGIGLITGSWASRFLARQALGNVTNLPRVFDPDTRVLIFTAITAVLTVLGFGVAPTLRAIAIGRNTMTGASLRGGIDRSAMKGMRPLVAVQVALAVVLVFAAVLLGRTLLNFTSIDPGFSDRLVVAVFDPVSSGYSADQIGRLDQSLAAAVQPLPGVVSVAISRCGLIAGCSSSGSFKFEGSEMNHSYSRNWISPGYFATVGIPLIAGREFDERDASSRPAAIISELIARHFFPGQNPIGKRMGFNDLDTEIIGVVRDARNITLHDPPVSMVYLPLHAKSDIGMRAYSIEMRVNGNPASFVNVVRSAVRRAEPALLANDISTMPARFARDTARERVVAYLAWSFALLTLLLASLGLYGVLAYEVARRTKEIGVRIALGARRTEVTRLILGEALGVTLAGIVVGLLGAAILARHLQSLLFEVSALSVSAFAIVPILFVIVAAVSAYLPARRAMKVDPMVALRYE
jgi:predicted permease